MYSLIGIHDFTIGFLYQELENNESKEENAFPPSIRIGTFQCIYTLIMAGFVVQVESFQRVSCCTFHSYNFQVGSFLLFWYPVDDHFNNLVWDKMESTIFVIYHKLNSIKWVMDVFTICILLCLMISFLIVDGLFLKHYISPIDAKRQNWMYYCMIVRGSESVSFVGISIMCISIIHLLSPSWYSGTFFISRLCSSSLFLCQLVFRIWMWIYLCMEHSILWNCLSICMYSSVLHFSLWEFRFTLISFLMKCQVHLTIRIIISIRKDGLSLRWSLPPSLFFVYCRYYTMQWRKHRALWMLSPVFSWLYLGSFCLCMLLTVYSIFPFL